MAKRTPKPDPRDWRAVVKHQMEKQFRIRRERKWDCAWVVERLKDEREWVTEGRFVHIAGARMMRAALVASYAETWLKLAKMRAGVYQEVDGKRN